MEDVCNEGYVIYRTRERERDPPPLEDSLHPEVQGSLYLAQRPAHARAFPLYIAAKWHVLPSTSDFSAFSRRCKCTPTFLWSSYLRAVSRLFSAFGRLFTTEIVGMPGKKKDENRMNKICHLLNYFLNARRSGKGHPPSLSPIIIR